MPKPQNQKQTNDSGLNFEAQLWAAADKMRGHMDAAEYKHVENRDSYLSASNEERVGVKCQNDGSPKGNVSFASVQQFNRPESRTSGRQNK